MAIEEREIHPVRWIALFIIFVAIIATVIGTIATVSAGHRGVLLTYGHVEDKILPEGISLITPYVNQVVVLSVQTTKYSATASSASADLQIVTTEVTLNYHLDAVKVNKIYQNLGLDWENRVIQPAIQEAVKASTAKYTAEELITKRSIVKDLIDQSLTEKLQPYGIVTETIYITDFKFSPDFEAAIEAKVTAVQLALKAENDLKRIKVEADQAIAVSVGQANATLIKATAEAQAISITGKALRENPQLVQLEWVKRWSGSVPATLIMSNEGSQPNLVLLLPSQTGS
jgi:regulator of protease activity HflC (stomatin/prohibitin superfamily)